MNIFASSNDPEECAKALDDGRVNKMILESAQMLSEAAHLIYGQSRVHKPFFTSHPCSVWVRRCDENFLWLSRHFMYLIAEYEYRGGSKNHACKNLFPTLHRCFGQLKSFANPADFANCASNASLMLTFSNLQVHDAYQAYLRWRWQNPQYGYRVSWLKRGSPSWR